MNWELLIPTTLATLVAVVGWIVAHRSNAARDIRNKQREIRVKYLTEIYEVLWELGRNVDIIPTHREVENAVSRIQLYGSERQIKLCEKFVREITETGAATYTDLTVDIRNSVREELGLDIVSTNLNLLKIEPVSRADSSAG